jgi:hypothetical protein
MKKTTIELNMSLRAYSFNTPEGENIVCCNHLMGNSYYIQDGKRTRTFFKYNFIEHWWDSLFESLGVEKPLEVHTRVYDDVTLTYDILDDDFDANLVKLQYIYDGPKMMGMRYNVEYIMYKGKKIYCNEPLDYEPDEKLFETLIVQ